MFYFLKGRLLHFKRACSIFKLCIFFTLYIASLRFIHSFFMCFLWVLLGNKNSVYHDFSRDKRYLLYSYVL